MAEKVSTIALFVDLDCPKCYKKVRKTLCKFNEIHCREFDEKQKKVIISGPFNPECLIKKLYCKVGCKIITGHEIITSKPPKPQPKPKPEPKPEPQPKPKPKPEPELKPPPPPPVRVCVCVGPICCCRPCCERRPPDGPCTRCPRYSYNDTCCRDCYEGRPWDGPCTRGGYDSRCRVFVEEDPCKIM